MTTTATKEASHSSSIKSSSSPKASPRESSDLSEDLPERHKVTSSRREQHSPADKSKERSNSSSATLDRSEHSALLLGSATTTPIGSSSMLSVKPTESGELDATPQISSVGKTKSRLQMQGSERSKSSKTKKEKLSETQEVSKMKAELAAANERIKEYEQEQLNLQLQLKELTEQNVRLMNQIYMTRQRFEFASSETLSSGTEKTRMPYVRNSRREGSVSGHSGPTPDTSGVENSLDSMSGSARSEYSNRSDEFSVQHNRTTSEGNVLCTSSTSERESGSLSPTGSSQHSRKPSKKSLPLTSGLVTSPFRKEKMLLSPPRSGGSAAGFSGSLKSSNSHKDKRRAHALQEDITPANHLDGTMTISFNTKHTIRSVVRFVFVFVIIIIIFILLFLCYVLVYLFVFILLRLLIF
jgi:hypothetical protein